MRTSYIRSVLLALLLPLAVMIHRAAYATYQDQFVSAPLVAVIGFCLPYRAALWRPIALAISTGALTNHLLSARAFLWKPFSGEREIMAEALLIGTIVFIATFVPPRSPQSKETLGRRTED